MAEQTNDPPEGAGTSLGTAAPTDDGDMFADLPQSSPPPTPQQVEQAAEAPPGSPSPSPSSSLEPGEETCEETTAQSLGSLGPSQQEGGGQQQQQQQQEQEQQQEGEEGEEGNESKKRKRLDWCRKIETLYVDVMQQGKLVDQQPLGSRSKWIFGRSKGTGVITLHNPSVSKKHAAIAVGVPPSAPAFDHGGITLMDLGAANGTYWTKSYPCRPGNREKLQKGGSVTLKEGYCFRFGESSQSFVVHGLAAMTQRRAVNPNFRKKEDSERIGRNEALSKDFGMGGTSRGTGGTGKTGVIITSNPFVERKEIDTHVYLPTVSADSQVSKTLMAGGTTFSFHKRRKTEMDHIRQEHEQKMRKRVLELKRKEADDQSALDMQTK